MEGNAVSRVLVLDQTDGDVSVTLGGAQQDAFRQMLDDALAHYPKEHIRVKMHPDVLCGKKAAI